VHPQSLSNTQIEHDLLATARDGISSDIAVQPLDLFIVSDQSYGLGTESYLRALPPTTIAQPPKDLTRLPGTELKRHSRLRLQPSNGAAELQHRLRLVHDLALVDDALQPVVGGLDLARHMCELQADDRVVDEFLAEGLALVGVLDGLLVADAGEADALDDDAHAFVIEVRHDDCEVESLACVALAYAGKNLSTFKTLVLLADQVLGGHFDVFEGHVGSSAGPYTLAVHPPRADTAVLALDEKRGNTVHAWATCANSGREVIAPDAVGDPFLLAVDNVVLPVFRELGLTSKIGNVTSGIWFGDGKTDPLVTIQDSW
jgi:hypothetical protein